MHRILALLTSLLLGAPALGQTVQYVAPVTRNHIPVWNSNGVIADGGSSADSPVSSLGVTNEGGAGLCVSSQRQTASGRQQLCLSAATAGNAIISLQNFGTATPQNLCFNINGTQTCIPTGGGGTVPTVVLPLTNLEPICASGTAGTLAGCTGTANTIPYWTAATTQGLIGPTASSVLVTSAGQVPSLSQTLPAAVQSNITTVGTITSGIWSGSPVTVTGGGTGAGSLTANGVLLGNGTSPVASLATPSVGLCLLSNGGSPPSWGGCASGAGSAAGPNNSVQFNNLSALAGTANLTWVSPALIIGQNAATTGQLVLANGGAAGTSVTIQSLGNTVAYNLNLPTTAGSSGQPMISGGGGAASMTFGTLGVAGGGTACSVASGTCVDNISGFGSTGFINRTGAGAYSFTPQIGMSNGGTGANLSPSNGGIVYSNAVSMAILSGTATANQMLQSGASSTPAWSTATWPATTTANQLLYSSATNTVVGLASANNGVLITSGAAVPSISSTLPAAVQANITATGTIASGTWQGTAIDLSHGGTNANLTASNGGIFYSTASAAAILAGTATANLPLLSGVSSAPSWAAISYPASATSGGIPYFSSTTALASSGLMTANALILGGGAGAAPTSLSCATSTTLLHGGTPPTCGQLVNADITTNTIANASLAQAADSTIKSNISGGTANETDNTITAVLDKQFGTTQGAVIYRNATVWTALAPGSSGQFLTTQGAAANPTWSSGGAGTGTVTNVTPGAGLVSSVTASCSQTAITASGTLSAARCVNAQTGASYAIVDGDRAKLVTAFNAGAQAYTIAQAGAASAFQSGWFVDVKNVSTNAAGIVTITPTTSTIDGAATLQLNPGRAARITSDGTNYQVSLTGGKQTLPTVQLFLSGSGTYTAPANVLWIEVELMGGGASGAGSGGGSPGAGVNGDNTCWNTTGAACTTPVYQAGGGTGGGTGGGGVQAAGGTISGSGTCSDSQPGGAAGGETSTSQQGGWGGSSRYGGAGPSGYGTLGATTGGPGGNAATNSGSGGGGGGTGTTSNAPGGGGGSGAWCYAIITAPAGTYTYVVAGSKTGGIAGTAGTAGGNSGGGKIRVTEHYGS